MRGSQTVFSTSATFPYGVHSFAVPAIKRTGQYTIHLAATDLAGNFNRIVGSVQITRYADCVRGDQLPRLGP